VSLEVVPVTLRDAYAFIREHHRHHPPPQGGLFAIGAARAGEVVGVIVVGRPNARCDADTWTAQVTRLATDGTPNACSLLYGAAWRAARAMGYRRLVTFTLQSESGGSLRAAGWTQLLETRGGSWTRRARPRVDLHPLEPKLRWEANVASR
jgi:hypothetical protein